MGDRLWCDRWPLDVAKTFTWRCYLCHPSFLDLCSPLPPSWYSLLLPQVIGKVLAMRPMFSGVMSSMQALMGGAAASGMPSEAELMGKLEELKAVIDAVQARIHSADETTFVCVCIPEFLSLYETERLVQELAKFDIDTHNIVVNQVLFHEAGGCRPDAVCYLRRNWRRGHRTHDVLRSLLVMWRPTVPSSLRAGSNCVRCAARMRMQGKYLDQIGDLYEDFHVVKTPLLHEEVRGGSKLKAFGQYLVAPYDPAVPLPAELGSSHK